MQVRPGREVGALLAVAPLRRSPRSAGGQPRTAPLSAALTRGERNRPGWDLRPYLTPWWRWHPEGTCTEEAEVKAHKGDTLTIKGHRVGEPERTGEIIDVHDTEGQVSYLVRWEDGHEAWLYPGPDAFVEPRKKAAK